MTLRQIVSPLLVATLAFAVSPFGATALAQTPAAAPLALSKSTITINGTSNVHDWTAATSSVRVAQAALAVDAKGPGFWDAVVKPAAISAFEVVIPVTTLTSPRSGLDKNMYKALKSDQHKAITFRLKSLTPKSTAGAFSAAGRLTVAGVEREVALNLTIGRSGQSLVVRGKTEILMTDFGIDPPRALLGTVRSSPNVTVSFETVVSSPLS